jgi:hypothetical protein
LKHFLYFTVPTTNTPIINPSTFSEYDAIHKLSVKSLPETSQSKPIISQIQRVFSQQNNKKVQSTTQNSQGQDSIRFTVPSVATTPTNSQKPVTSDGYIPRSYTEQVSVLTNPRISPYLNIYQNIPLIPLIPITADSKVLVRFVPILSPISGPQHIPQIPFIPQNVPEVTPAHTNAPQVPLISQNAPQVPLVPEYSKENFPRVPFASQNSDNAAFIPGASNVNILQVPYHSQNVPQVSIVPENAYDPQAPSVSQNIQVPLAPENVPANSPQVQVKSVSQNYPQILSVLENVNEVSAQVPFVSENAIPTTSVPVKPQIPVNYTPQTGPEVILVPVNFQKEAPEVGVPSLNVPKETETFETSENLKVHTDKFSHSSESFGKTHNISHCPTIISKGSETKYPTLTFKNVLNPSVSIQKYYQKTSSVPDKNRFFRCHRENKRSLVSSPDWLSYHCHHDDIPVELLVEVPRALRDEPVIDVELYTPYSALVSDAWNGKYEGVEKTSFLKDVLTPCSYGMAVLRHEGSSASLVPMPVAVPDGKFVTPKIQ